MTKKELAEKLERLEQHVGLLENRIRMLESRPVYQPIQQGPLWHTLPLGPTCGGGVAFGLMQN